MTTLQGTIHQKGSVVVSGRELQFLILTVPVGLVLDAKPFYKAIFVERVNTNDPVFFGNLIRPSPLALKLAAMEKGTRVAVTIEGSSEVPLWVRPDFNTQVYVTDIEEVIPAVRRTR
jgi:hypothetical protein